MDVYRVRDCTWIVLPCESENEMEIDMETRSTQSRRERLM